MEPKEYVLEILGIKSMNNIYSELITSFEISFGTNQFGTPSPQK